MQEGSWAMQSTSSLRRSPSRWERWALASGILFAATQLAALLFAFGVVVPTHAPVGAPAQETAAALAANSTIIAFGTYLTTVPMPFLLIFLGGLHELLRRSHAGGPALATAALAAGVAAAVIVPFGAVLSGLSAPVALQGGDPVLAKELDSITPLAMALSGYPYAVLAGAVSIAVLRGGLAPRWVGWLGVAVVAVSLAATATIAVNALFPLTLLVTLLFPVWVLSLSIALVRQGRRVEVSERAAA
jgi:hypothetical protein